METIEAAMRRICTQNDLSHLQLEIRDAGTLGQHWGATAIWGEDYRNCWETGGTAAEAIVSVLARAKAVRTKVPSDAAPIGAGALESVA